MKPWTLILLAVLTVSVLSCGKQQPAGTTIAVIPKGTTHEFWKSVHAGAVKAAREYQVEVIWKGPLREDDREQQISVVESFVTRGVSGIVLAPLDDAALRGSVHNAVAAGIPVVIIDSDLRGNEYASFVATDNYRGGKIGGEEMVRLLHGRGKIVMMRFVEGSASTAHRERGFLDAIATAPGIEVISSNQYGGPTVETAYRSAENLLAPLRNAAGALTIDGIFCPNESTTFGMLRALQDGGHAGKIRFVGFDGSPKLIEALEQSSIDALVLQNPFRMGYVGVSTMMRHLRGESVDKRIDTGVSLVTRENMHQPEMQEVLHPNLSTWLE
jgi:ribose transport system substrate-binding protein